MGDAPQLHPREPGGVSAPLVKGWCPGAHKPMASGDGLVVRVRPFCGRLSAAQALGLCDLAERYGSGALNLTSRANVQLRGVTEAAHPALLHGLDALGLIDDDPNVEGHRNILVPPDWAEGDVTHRLHQALLTGLADLPDLPHKMGFALDTGAASCLTGGSADIRIERTSTGDLMVRADGSPLGHLVKESGAIDAVRHMAQWFITSGGRAAGRMAKHLAHVPVPPEWAHVAPRAPQPSPPLGPGEGGPYLGVPFGALMAHDLRALVHHTGTAEVRLCLNRCIYLPGIHVAQAPGFETTRTPVMQAHACPGAPLCPQASVTTQDIAQALAAQLPGLHVSGCAKGCALPRRAPITLVGQDGMFDLVRDGCAWDEPCQRGLRPAQLCDLT